jgi:hypothetical protein
MIGATALALTLAQMYVGGMAARASAGNRGSEAPVIAVTSASRTHIGSYSVPLTWQCVYDGSATLTAITHPGALTVSMSSYWHQFAHGGYGSQYVATYVKHQVLVGAGWHTAYSIEYLKNVPFGRSVNATAGVPHKLSEVRSFPSATASRITVTLDWLQPRTDNHDVVGGKKSILVGTYGGNYSTFGRQSTCPNTAPEVTAGPKCADSPHLLRDASATPSDDYYVMTFYECHATPGYDAGVHVTVLDSVADPVVNQQMRFTVTGRNSAAGTVLTDSTGEADFSYPVIRAGLDTVTVFDDVNGDGVLDDGEPNGKTAITNPAY